MLTYYLQYCEYVKALCISAWEGDWIRDRAENKIVEPYLN
jgi:hypothetical protein